MHLFVSAWGRGNDDHAYTTACESLWSQYIKSSFPLLPNTSLRVLRILIIHPSFFVFIFSHLSISFKLLILKYIGWRHTFNFHFYRFCFLRWKNFNLAHIGFFINRFVRARLESTFNFCLSLLIDRPNCLSPLNLYINHRSFLIMAIDSEHTSTKSTLALMFLIDVSNEDFKSII